MSNVIIIVSAYLLLINIIAFVLYGIDKKQARRRSTRIPSSVLLWMARIGGGLGSWFAMSVFHHKKHHSDFRRLVPIWIMIWLFIFVIVVIVCSGNLGSEIKDAGGSILHSNKSFD